MTPWIGLFYQITMAIIVIIWVARETLSLTFAWRRCCLGRGIWVAIVRFALDRVVMAMPDPHALTSTEWQTST